MNGALVGRLGGGTNSRMCFRLWVVRFAQRQPDKGDENVSNFSLRLVVWVGCAGISKYEESIYGMRRGPFDPTDQYVAPYGDNKIYIHVLDWKGKNNISQPAVTDRIVKKAWIMDDPSDADYSWGFIRQHPWGLLVVVPEDRQHQPDTIS